MYFKSSDFHQYQIAYLFYFRQISLFCFVRPSNMSSIGVVKVIELIIESIHLIGCYNIRCQILQLLCGLVIKISNGMMFFLQLHICNHQQEHLQQIQLYLYSYLLFFSIHFYEYRNISILIMDFLKDGCLRKRIFFRLYIYLENYLWQNSYWNVAVNYKKYQMNQGRHFLFVCYQKFWQGQGSSFYQH